MSLTGTYCCWLSITVSLVLWSYYMSLTVSHCCWRSFTVSPGTKELLHVPQSLLLMLVCSHCLS